MLGKVSQNHETYLLDQQLFFFSKIEVMQNTDLNILHFIIHCQAVLSMVEIFAEGKKFR